MRCLSGPSSLEFWKWTVEELKNYFESALPNALQ